jgi:hypothetical protein
MCFTFQKFLLNLSGMGTVTEGWAYRCFLTASQSYHLTTFLEMKCCTEFIILTFFSDDSMFGATRKKLKSQENHPV